MTMRIVHLSLEEGEGGRVSFLTGSQSLNKELTDFLPIMRKSPVESDGCWKGKLISICMEKNWERKELTEEDTVL
jgi:hypothetical protein